MRPAAFVLFPLLSATCGATIAVQSAPPRGAPAPPVVLAPDPPPAPKPPEKPAEPTKTPAVAATAPNVWVVLTKPTAAGAAKVKVKGAWTLVSADGAPIRNGVGLDGDLALGGTIATLVGASFPDDAELRPSTDGDLSIDARVYPGALRVDRGEGGKRRAMIATDVETYVACVVNSEIPAAFAPEAQRVQAVVARSYALRSTVRTSPDAPLVLHDVGGIDQEFAGLTNLREHRRVGSEAARTTRGLVLVDQGSPLLAYYHSTCGGTTCPGEVVFGKLGASPALRGGVECAWCTASKYYRWESKASGADVAKAAGMSGALTAFSLAEKTAGGRAASFDVTVGGKTKRVRAADFRLRIGASAMRSTLVETAVLGGELVLSGRGWGHGVGLCQMGAKTLAENGEKAEQILARYYPGAALEKRW
jgi:stage II sporulation protein D